MCNTELQVRDPETLPTVHVSQAVYVVCARTPFSFDCFNNMPTVY